MISHELRAALFSALVLTLVSSATRADDRFPPAWVFGQNTVYAAWSFPISNPSGPAPDNNPSGTQSLTVFGNNPPTTRWLTVDGRTAWQLDAADGARLEIHVLRSAANRRDRVHVQVTSRGGPPVVSVTGDDGPAFTQYGSASVFSGLPDWTTSLTEWTRNTCPGVEVIRITPPAGGSVVVDDVIMYSNCEFERHSEDVVDGSIDIAFDPQGMSCSGAVPPLVSTPLYVIARLRGATVQGIGGAEFAIADFPLAEVFVTMTPAPGFTVNLGDPFRGCDIGFGSCQPGPTVLLYTLGVFPIAPLPSDRLIQVLAHWTPSSPNFACPRLDLCSNQGFQPICVAGGAAILNPTGSPCTVAVAPVTWARMKSLFR